MEDALAKMDEVKEMLNNMITLYKNSVMEKGSTSYPDFHNPAWCTLPARWTRYTSEKYFMWGPNQAENFNKALKAEELAAILNYYGGKKNLYEILHDGLNTTKT